MAYTSAEYRRICNVVEQSYRRNLPIELCNLNRDQIARINMCKQVAKRIQDNPLMNVNEFLRVVFKRTDSEIAYDKRLIDFIRNLLYGVDSREMAIYIAEHEAKKVMQIGNQTGDPKWIAKGVELYAKIKQLDQPAPQEDLTEQTPTMPWVFVSDISYKDPNRQSLSEEGRKKILQQWGVNEDESSRLIDEYKQKLLESDKVAEPEYEEG